MASASASTQNSVGGSTSEATVVIVLPCSRNQEIWAYFDLCEMSNGSQKARCKLCGKILGAAGNSTLRKHIGSHAKHTQGEDQTQIGRDEGVWQYNVESVRERMTHFVIQEGLPFDHFDNPRLTRMIQETLQPSYTNALT
ncbi:hypothetical protein L1987_23818 [Smallanthus sonchifolius]|uniref:Uncharacterized protein n=1 Tax=Smallanthus sonchifolius TaxID=185202 RepID=A0ACB9ILC7_9ASTR|nr:hypothetical protein L1987_23818 [Smallanthus sonchifolius]